MCSYLTTLLSPALLNASRAHQAKTQRSPGVAPCWTQSITTSDKKFNQSLNWRQVKWRNHYFGCSAFQYVIVKWSSTNRLAFRREPRAQRRDVAKPPSMLTVLQNRTTDARMQICSIAVLPQFCIREEKRREENRRYSPIFLHLNSLVVLCFPFPYGTCVLESECTPRTHSA